MVFLQPRKTCGYFVEKGGTYSIESRGKTQNGWYSIYTHHMQSKRLSVITCLQVTLVEEAITRWQQKYRWINVKNRQT